MSVSRYLSLFFVCGVALVGPRPADAACGSVINVDTHDGTTTSLTLAGMPAASGKLIVLLVGGGGYLALGRDGCPARLKGNSLVRMRPLFHSMGYATALVDAPSDHQSRDGLGGFRTDPDHAKDIGAVITEMRRRTGLETWLAGTSRGAISAANAAARLRGSDAPDGLVLTSPVTEGLDGALKSWVEQDVFDLPLGQIRMPVLVAVHREDKCVRTPPQLGSEIIAKTESPREQFAVVTGGPGWPGGVGGEACRGRSPHGFLDQEPEVASGIVRFIGGGTF
ncbi:MAG: hypothetical protein RIA64_05045 [Rhodospirillales bacterium]